VGPAFERGLLRLVRSPWPSRGLSLLGRLWSGVPVGFAKRFFSEVDPRCRAKIFEHLLFPATKPSRGFPPVIFLSLTTRCQLNCPGCSVRKDNPVDLGFEMADRVVAEGRAAGTRMFILLGGEPFLWPGLADLIIAHPDVYFQVATNGLLVDRAWTGFLWRAANAALTFSLDGPERETDRLRGPGVYRRVAAGMASAKADGLPFAADVLVGRENFASAQSLSFVREVIDRGAFLLYYLPYKPVGASPDPALVLTPDERRRLYRRVVELRARLPIVTVDHEFDMGPLGGCIATQGLAIYVSAAGVLQPCSNLHYGDTRLDGRLSLIEAYRKSALLRRLGEVDSPRAVCPLTDRPQELRSLLEEVFPGTCRDFPDYEFLCRYARTAEVPQENVYAGEKYDFYARFAALTLRSGRRTAARPRLLRP
jgi:MoaA/NifB/PqqE/SkfB family radical SAM enzyme